MSNREYLTLTPQRGMWYVSNHGNLYHSEGSTVVGIGSSPGQLASNCIVGGPFPSEQDASEWRQQHPEHSTGGFVWQQEV